jgi:hypothetical protein
MTAGPPRDHVRARVACALARGLGGAERPTVERWLGGCRRIDGLIVPFAGAAPRCPACGEQLLRDGAGWRCPNTPAAA